MREPTTIAIAPTVMIRATGIIPVPPIVYPGLVQPSINKMSHSTATLKIDRNAPNFVLLFQKRAASNTGNSEAKPVNDQTASLNI